MESHAIGDRQQLQQNRQKACEDDVFNHHPVSFEFWGCVAAALACVAVAGIMSGLTVGLLGLDQTTLQLKLNGPNPQERKWAAKILRITADHHRLLISLLLANTAANELLPIALERIVPPYVAFMLSVVSVLVFGEIIPMSVLTGPKQLELSARVSIIVEWLMVFLWCLASPVARLLDRIVGEKHGSENTLFNRRELRTIIKLSSATAAAAGKASSADHEASIEEASIEEGQLAIYALDFATKKVGSCMRGLNECFMLDAGEALTGSLLQRIREAGYSRIPVFANRRDHIVYVLLAKSLVGVAPQPDVTLQEWCSLSDRAGLESDGITHAASWRRPLVAPVDLPLLSLLRQFHTNSGGCQLAVVVEQVKDGSDEKVLGFVTVEDVLEELLQGEIEDEFDKIRRAAQSHRIPSPVSKSWNDSLLMFRRSDSSPDSRWHGSDVNDEDHENRSLLPAPVKIGQDHS